MSGPSDESHVYVADLRRRRTREEKLAIVRETKDAPVNRVARRHGLSPGLVFRWRKQLAQEAGLALAEPAARFVPIALRAPEQPLRRTGSPGSIEIVLAGGRRVIVDKDFDRNALKRVIEALEAG
ncbi:MAG TPA: transposase [Rhizomicrobium sp.]|nr:transposase [Rhizomicrobium sp.]